MQKINHLQIRGQPQLNIPKTPEHLFLKNKDVNQHDIHAATNVTTDALLKTVKYIDELYTKQFLDEYFTI